MLQYALTITPSGEDRWQWLVTDISLVVIGQGECKTRDIAVTNALAAIASDIAHGGY